MCDFDIERHLEKLRENVSNQPELLKYTTFINSLNNLLEEKGINRIELKPSYSVTDSDDIPF